MRITESQLRRIVRQEINEMAAALLKLVNSRVG